MHSQIAETAEQLTRRYGANWPHRGQCGSGQQKSRGAGGTGQAAGC